MGSILNLIFDSIKSILEIIKWPLAVIIISFMLRKTIDRAIQKISTFKFIRGESSIEASTTSPDPLSLEQDGKSYNREKLDIEQASIPPPKVESEETQNWKSRVFKAIDNKEFITAKEIFAEGTLTTTDPNLQFKEKSFFLYMLYMADSDYKLLNEFESHLEKPTNEDVLVDGVEWYIYCLEKSKNYTASTEYLLNLQGKIKSDINRTKIICLLSERYILSSDFQKAREMLSDRLELETSKEEKYLLYKNLAKAEEKLSNASVSALCLDKALEFRPEDAELMFSAAYKASNNHLKALEISNYDILTDINPQDDSAWNNFAISADGEKIKSVALRYFERSIKLENSLAMANKGNKLLDIGFLAEAKKIADQAIKTPTPHENIYKLLQKIKETEDADLKKWNEIREGAFRKQKEFREYVTYKFENKSIFEFPEILESEDGEKFSLEKTDKKTIKIKNNNEEKIISIIGDVDNRAINGVYSESYPNGNSSLLSSSKNKTIKCFGFYDDKSGKLILSSDDFKDNFKISLSKV